MPLAANPAVLPQPDLETTEAIVTVVQLTRAGVIFDEIADALIAGVRQAMGFPAHGDPEVEQEFAFLRGALNDFFPEFRQLFGGLLIKYVGQEHLPEVIEGLASEPAQRYLQAAHHIEAELQQQLGRLSQKMLLAAQASLVP